MASRSRGNRKSGEPGTCLGCRRQPVILARRKARTTRSSVLALPRLLTRDMIFERLAGENTSTMRRGQPPSSFAHRPRAAMLADSFLSSTLIDSARTFRPPSADGYGLGGLFSSSSRSRRSTGPHPRMAA